MPVNYGYMSQGGTSPWDPAATGYDAARGVTPGGARGGQTPLAQVMSPQFGQRDMAYGGGAWNPAAMGYDAQRGIGPGSNRMGYQQDQMMRGMYQTGGADAAMMGTRMGPYAQGPQQGFYANYLQGGGGGYGQMAQAPNPWLSGGTGPMAPQGTRAVPAANPWLSGGTGPMAPQPMSTAAPAANVMRNPGAYNPAMDVFRNPSLIRR